MSDNRITELLKDYAFALRRFEYDVDKPGSNMTFGEYEAEEKKITDEYSQAIAATLGGGTLTARQLIVIAEGHQPNYCSNTHVCFDWHAIADELNAVLGSSRESELRDALNEVADKWAQAQIKAEDHAKENALLKAKLGVGECENIAPDYLDFLCSKCGFVHYHSDENDTGDGNDWNYCPSCRAKVIK